MVFAQQLCLFINLFLPLPLQKRTNLLSFSYHVFYNMNNNNSISMAFSCGSHYYDGEEPEVPLINETKRCAAMDVQVHNELHEGQVELLDFEFWPVEHPSEPPDEDHPLKCPMPDSSVINDGGTGRVSESNYKSSMPRKRTEVSSPCFMEMVDQPPVPVAVPVRTVRKRHHTLTRGGGEHVISPLRRMQPHPPRPLPAQNITVFQMLQQLDKS
ncbi:PREDICTED: uncharacterized protein LOC101296099 isoform X2 [Fragaria vesca subsp. vesca]|uniref:uncharacterized protein LOC101296099 isoform X2 n=1 Tax=Fragaria vesca subsp. vesca TaxID=101020 RepID=UPI0002C345E0|nr:PREDICTED: uncharacterized protein LOC101296099 isoform X2 [Fragaria vesca subsp. vesca]